MRIFKYGTILFPQVDLGAVPSEVCLIVHIVVTILCLGVIPYTLAMKGFSAKWLIPCFVLWAVAMIVNINIDMNNNF